MTPAVQFDDLAISVLLRKSDLYRSAIESATRLKLWWFMAVWFYFVIWSAINTKPYAWAYALPISLMLCIFMVCAGAWTASRTPGILTPITYVFSEEGLAVRYVSSTGTVEWPLIKAAWETRRYFFVYQQRGSFTLVPKAQISAETAARLRGILRSKLGDKARLFAD